MTRIRRRSPDGTPCVLAELGRAAPLAPGSRTNSPTRGLVDRIAALVDGRSDEVLDSLRERLLGLSADGRFDQAAVARDRLSALAAAADRRQRLGALVGDP